MHIICAASISLQTSPCNLYSTSTSSECYSGKLNSPMAALPRYPTLLSSQRTVLVETGLFRCCLNATITLAAVVRYFLQTVRLNAHRSLSVSLEIRPELLRFLEGFPCFLNSVMVLDMAALEKPPSSYVVVTEAHAIGVTTICPFLNSVRSRI